MNGRHHFHFLVSYRHTYIDSDDDIEGRPKADQETDKEQEPKIEEAPITGLTWRERGSISQHLLLSGVNITIKPWNS